MIETPSGVCYKQFKNIIMRTLMTKEARNEALSYEFARLEANGLTKENYKTLIIFSGVQNDWPTLKIFRGNSTKAICYYRYRSLDQMNEAVKRYKDNEDRNQAYKEERKQTTKRLTGAAACADAIRKELKEVFPLVKFSVKSETFSGGDSVRVGWFDAITTDKVNEVITKYQYGHFDGMTDNYEHSNSRDDIPQAKYVSGNRTISDEHNDRLKELLKPIFEQCTYGCHSLENMAWRVFYKTEIPAHSKIKELKLDYSKCLFPEVVTVIFE